MTYKKPLKAFQATTLMGEQVSAQDTDTERIGSYAIEAFEGKKIIKGKDTNDAETLVPFHAVKSAQYGVMTEDAERTDPYCGGGTDGDTYTINFVPNPDYSTCDKETVIVQENVKIGDTIEYPSCECESPTFMGGWTIHDIGYTIDQSYKPTLDQEIASYAVNGVITLDQSCER